MTPITTDYSSFVPTQSTPAQEVADMEKKVKEMKELLAEYIIAQTNHDSASAENISKQMSELGASMGHSDNQSFSG